MSPIRTPVTAPRAWRSRDFADRHAYTFDLGSAHFAVFDAALGVNRAAGRSAEDVSVRDFALGAIAAEDPEATARGKSEGPELVRAPGPRSFGLKPRRSLPRARGDVPG